MFYEQCFQIFKTSKINSFDINFFKKINDPQKIFEYAKLNLKNIGKGSSRFVFIINDKYVLKVAIPDNLIGGTFQNKSEQQISNRFSNITANVIEHHPEYYWVISELASPLNSQQELLRSLNLSSPVDLAALFSKFPPKNHKFLKEPNSIAKEVSSLVQEKILPRDVMKSDSWGYTKDKKLVLIDYGKLN